MPGIDTEKCKGFLTAYRKCIVERCEKYLIYGECLGLCPWEVAQADGTFKFNEKYCKEMINYIVKGAYIVGQKNAFALQQQSNQNEKDAIDE